MTADPGRAPVPVAASPGLGQDPVLDIRDLSVVYRTPGGDVRAVDQVNLSLAPGEVVGLCGESGSGKSTLVYGACRLLRAPALITSGSVTYSGRRVTKPADVLRMRPEQLQRLRWREVAIVFQSAMNALNPVLNVRDQLLDVIHAHLRVSRDEARERAASLLDLVGIPRSRLRSYPHELSGGMRQRVMIAMALATDPEVVIMDDQTTALDVVVQRDILLLADEPVSMLDVSIRLEMLGLLDDLRQRFSLAMLYITHDIASARYFADEVLVMYAGEIVERGPAEEVTQQPAHPYTQLLGASAPDPDNLGSTLRRGANGARRQGARNPEQVATVGCPFSPRCPLAEDRCRREDPPLEPITATRGAACWRLDAAAPELIPGLPGGR